MRKWLLPLLITAPVYGQVFTEDISKISHFIAEEEITSFMENPTSEGLPAEYLEAITLPKYTDPKTTCEEDPAKFKPLNIHYELIAVTEDVPVAANVQPQTTVIVARYQEPESFLVTKLKSFLTSQARGGGKPDGKFAISQNQDAGKKIVLFAAPGTSIKLNSEVKADATYNVDVIKILSAPVSSGNAQIQMDVSNKISIDQEIVSGTDLKGSLESLHTTGARALNSLSGTRFELSTVRAVARIDSAISRNVQGYSQVNYTASTYDNEVRAIAGFDIKAASNAQIMIFTGYSARRTGLNRDLASRDKELGMEYKKKGVSVFGRFKDGEQGKGRSFETGIKIDLNR